MEEPETTGEETKAEEKEEEEKEGEAAEENTGAVSINVLVNNQLVVLEGKSEYVYVDVFEKIDFDRSRPKGMGIVATLNGRPAQYMEAIQDGDVLEIYWRA